MSSGPGLPNLTRTALLTRNYPRTRLVSTYGFLPYPFRKPGKIFQLPEFLPTTHSYAPPPSIFKLLKIPSIMSARQPLVRGILSPRISLKSPGLLLPLAPDVSA